MALNYTQNSPYIYAKIETGGRHYCLPLYLPKRLKTAENMNPTAAKQTENLLDKLAHEAEDSYRDTANGELTEEEFLEKMRIIFRRLTRTLCTTPTVIFLAVWLWEWALRGRPDFHKVAFPVKTLDNLLTMWKTDARKPVTSLTAKHFTDYIWQRREDNYAASSVNDEVQLLRSLGRALKDKLGYDPAKDLEFERCSYGKRVAFTIHQLKKIIKYLGKQGSVGQEWKTLILLIIYTSIRPGQACRLRKSAIRISGKIRTITFIDTKADGKIVVKPINDTLWAHLSKVLRAMPKESDDLLMPTLYRKDVEGRSSQFRRILTEVGIKLVRVDLPHAKVRQYSQCLYALRKTFNIWQHGLTTKRQRQERMGQASAKAHAHYEDDLDPYVIQKEYELFNLAPCIT